MGLKHFQKKPPFNLWFIWWGGVGEVSFLVNEVEMKEVYHLIFYLHRCTNFLGLYRGIMV